MSLQNKDRVLLRRLITTGEKLVILLEKQQKNQLEVNTLNTLPEWVTLEMAVEKKGVEKNIFTYTVRNFLQPCCGKNYKLIDGKKYWKKEDVLEWFKITDDLLPEYAKKWKVQLP